MFTNVIKKRGFYPNSILNSTSLLGVVVYVMNPSSKSPVFIGEEMPERIIKRSRNFTPNLYFYVPFKTKRDYKIAVGDKLLCILKRILDPRGNVIHNLEKELECEVRQRDGRFYLDQGLVTELDLFGDEYFEFILLAVIRANGEKVEIYPGEFLERDIELKPKG
jgi:hypothetical protein